MAQRFCTRCDAEVEDAGGYCLLGHSLRLEAATDTLSALRAEVNRTFDEAREQLAGVTVSGVVQVTPPPPSVAALPPAPPPPAPATTDATASPHPETAAVVQAEELAVTPPAPPQVQAVHHSVWDALEDTPSLAADDPIASFAPAPRMDWGPNRSPRLGRGRSRSRSPKLQPDG